MTRQKIASLLLVFALVGVTVTACTTQQRSESPTATKGVTKRPTRGGTPMMEGPEHRREPATTQQVKRGGWPTMRSTPEYIWTSLAEPTGNVATATLGIEHGSPREARAGQPIESKMIVTNLTDHTVTDVIVISKPDPILKLTASSPQGKLEGDGDYVWNLGNLGPRATKTITATGVASGEGSVTYCTAATYDLVVCTTIPIVQPKLRLVKTAPTEALSCEDIVYQFAVTNTGTGTIDAVKITDPLPAGLATADGKRTLMHNVGKLGPGQTKEFTSRVKANATGRFENKATASGDAAGAVTAESAMVATVVRKPVLTVNASCGRGAFIGRAATYQVTVTNTGDGPAENVVIENTLPSGAPFISATDGGRSSGGKVMWNLGTLAPKATKTVSYDIRPSSPGTYRHLTSARAECADTVTDSCENEFTGIPAILLEVIDLEDPDEVGTTETYVITVTNQGSAPDTGIRVVCTLEPNQDYVSSTGATVSTARGNVITFAPVQSLGPKQVAEWRLVVQNVRPGDVRFSVTMNSDQLTRPVAETEATRIYE